MITPSRMARIAGALWLLSVVGGIYAEVFVRRGIIVHGNAAATAANIMAAQATFRAGFVADLLADMAYLGMMVILYTMLRQVSRLASQIMLSFGLAGSIVMAANLVNLFAPVILLTTGTTSASPSPEIANLVLVHLRLHSFGYAISIALFSVQVAAIGHLILRSRYFPRIFGILFFVEAACNAVSTIGGFLDLDWVGRLGTYLLLPGLPAEAGFALWLLIVGIRGKEWMAAERADGVTN